MKITEFKNLNNINFSSWYLPQGRVFDKSFLEFYKKVLTPQRTRKEIAFIIKVLKLKPKMKILDLACGWGRHAIEFAKKGFDVVGQDINSYFLKEAAKEAKRVGVKIKWTKSDMRKIPFRNEFDAVLNLFTSFGYFEKEEDHQKVISEVANALKPGGYFFLDVINRERILHPYKSHRIIKTKSGDTLIIKTNFDLISSRNNEERILILKNREKKKFYISGRIFTLTELFSMVKKSGLIFRKVYGVYDGNHFSLRSERCIVIAQKK